jgi:hypothetical protein
MAAGCGGCAARRAAERAGKISYVWTSADGTRTTTYTKEVEAKAKVMMRGGSYVPVQGG